MSDVAQAVTAPLEGITSSIQAWLEKLSVDTKIAPQWVPVAFASLFLWLLFIHFLLFATQHNKNIQNVKNIHQSVFEVRLWLQANVVVPIVVYGSQIMGVMVGAQGSLMLDVAQWSYYSSMFLLIILINKFCVVLLSTVSNAATSGALGSAAVVGLDSQLQFKYPDGTSGGVYPLTGAGHVALSDTKLYTLYVVVKWLHFVTDVVLTNVPQNFLQGLVFGKVVSYIRR